MLFGVVAFRHEFKHKINLFTLVFFTGMIPFYNFIQGRGNGLTFTWLVGMLVFLSYSYVKQITVPKHYNLILLSLIFLAFERGRKTWLVFKTEYDPLFSILLGAILLFSLWGCHFGKFNFLKKNLIVKFLSSMSFSLYITHYTILDFIYRVFPTFKNRILLFIISIIVCEAVGWLLYVLVERNSYRVQKWWNSRHIYSL